MFKKKGKFRFTEDRAKLTDEDDVVIYIFKELDKLGLRGQYKQKYEIIKEKWLK